MRTSEGNPLPKGGGFFFWTIQKIYVLLQRVNPEGPPVERYIKFAYFFLEH